MKGGVQHHIIGPTHGARGRVKRSNIIKLQLQRFLNQLCACSHRYRYKTYQTEFSIFGLALGVGFGGAGGSKF